MIEKGMEDDFLPEFYAEKIPDEVFRRMRGKSFREGCPVSREELRYLKISHFGFDGMPRTGEMVAAGRIADDLLEIFQKLFQARYPIERIRLIDDYGGSDAASMRDNNTSCFHFRTISGSKKLSKHSLGLAVDVNPLYNPYVKTAGNRVVTEPPEARVYADRSAEFPHKITEEDLCCRLFCRYGFEWGGAWKAVRDYQHFEKKIPEP